MLDAVFDCLTAWLAPVLVFTAEEAWLARNPSADGSVHLRTFPDLPDEWRDDALAAKWEAVRAVRRVVTGALEVERADKRIGASLQAAPAVFVTAEQQAALTGIDFADICITSGVDVQVGEGPEAAFRLPDFAGVAVVPKLASGAKCGRCWQVLPEVGHVPGHDDLCKRCAQALDGAVPA